MTVLKGIRVLEFAQIGPVSHAGMLLADLGADIVRVDRPTETIQLIDPERDVLLRSRRSLVADLRDPVQLQEVSALIERADVLLEGYRPGVAERLGIGPQRCLALNDRLVYGRMTGWGQDGPLAQTAGHDINYLALSGVLSLMGRAGERPQAPLNLVADFGGGSLYLVVGVLGALIERARSGQGQIVDAAMVDGATSLIAMYWALEEAGLWSRQRGSNLIDGGAPFYDTYRCLDGRYVAVGAVEPAFYALLLQGLGLSSSDLPPQMDRAHWAAVKQRFTEIFATRSRDAWASTFSGGDACVTPVLELDEAAGHAHMQARGTVMGQPGQRQPAPAPRFSRSEPRTPSPPPVPGVDRASVLRDWGITAAPGR